jgi:hypothetical protein
MRAWLVGSSAIDKVRFGLLELIENQSQGFDGACLCVTNQSKCERHCEQPPNDPCYANVHQGVVVA